MLTTGQTRLRAHEAALPNDEGSCQWFQTHFRQYEQFCYVSPSLLSQPAFANRNQGHERPEVTDGDRRSSSRVFCGTSSWVFRACKSVLSLTSSGYRNAGAGQNACCMADVHETSWPLVPQLVRLLHRSMFQRAKIYTSFEQPVPRVASDQSTNRVPVI